MPKEIIERTWKHDMCQTGWRLRLASWGEASERNAFVEHVQGCQACQEYFREQREAAEKAEHPEVTDE
jgi:hypothetical protein